MHPTWFTAVPLTFLVLCLVTCINEEGDYCEENYLFMPLCKWTLLLVITFYIRILYSLTANIFHIYFVSVFYFYTAVQV